MKPFSIAEVWRSRIPERTVQVLERYVNYGPAALSSFHDLLLSGDAFGAATVADSENLAAMGAILAMVAADFPGDCYGTPEAVNQWQGLMHGQRFQVPESWAVAVEELRHDGPKSADDTEESAHRGRELN